MKGASLICHDKAVEEYYFEVLIYVHFTIFELI
jgi:hypothetical protein